jgi:hypothetical protein
MFPNAQLLRPVNFLSLPYNSWSTLLLFRASAGATVEVEWEVLPCQGREIGMTSKRRCTLGLFAGGVALLLFSSWLLHITLPPREVGIRPVVRKALRAGRGQRRSEAIPYLGLLQVAWNPAVNDGCFRNVGA